MEACEKIEQLKKKGLFCVKKRGRNGGGFAVQQDRNIEEWRRIAWSSWKEKGKSKSGKVCFSISGVSSINFSKYDHRVIK